MLKRLKIWFELYSCNYKKNYTCRQSCCKYYKCGDCKMTSKWEHARRTPLNYLKRMINSMKGKK